MKDCEIPLTYKVLIVFIAVVAFCFSFYFVFHPHYEMRDHLMVAKAPYAHIQGKKDIVCSSGTRTIDLDLIESKWVVEGECAYYASKSTLVWGW